MLYCMFYFTCDRSLNEEWGGPSVGWESTVALAGPFAGCRSLRTCSNNTLKREQRRQSGATVARDGSIYRNYRDISAIPILSALYRSGVFTVRRR